MMKRIILMVTVGLVMALMMAVAGPAFATVHPLAKMECASDSASPVVQTQDPPGLTPAPFGTGQSQGSPPNNPFGSTLAQPVFAVGLNSPQGFENPAFKPEGC